jgi:hypothetical protein
MTRRLLLMLAPLALTGAALAQPPSTGVDWSKPVTGVDAPATRPAETVEIKLDLVLESPAHKPSPSSPAMIQNPEAAATPLPPPCDPPLPRAPTEPPGPTAPDPCRP